MIHAAVGYSHFARRAFQQPGLKKKYFGMLIFIVGRSLWAQRTMVVLVSMSAAWELSVTVRCYDSML